MKLEIVERGSAVVAVVKGSLTAADSDALPARLRSEHVQRSAKRYVLDVAGLDVIDSSGIGALVSCLHHFRSRASDVVLVGLKGRVLTTMQIARADRLFQMFDTVDQAIDAK